ncbi:MAG: DUF6382 domain-containing protein [Eubacteriales bacterium]|nr:DUF6382 domain-containing protein [Eubacteriales bacterium]MDD3349299.1 DUF6382 domain-containing protein [Eubacteriales bacterium]
MFKLEELKKEEIGGRLVLSIENTKDWPPVYQKRVLEKGCKGLLQMTFLEIEENCRIYYQVDSYKPFTDYLESLFSNKRELHSNPTREILRILIDVLSCVLDAEDCLLFVEAFAFNKDTIFVHIDTKEVRLAYLPTTKAGQTGNPFLKELIEAISNQYQEEQWQSCAQELLCEIEQKNKGSLELIKWFREKARDLHLRGWPNEELERSVEGEVDNSFEIAVDCPEKAEKKRSVFSFDKRK